MNENLKGCQKRLHSELSSVLDGGCFRNAQRLLWNPVIARRWCRQKCDEVLACFREFERELKTHDAARGDEEVLSIEPYTATNWAVLKLQRRLSATLADDLAGAYVHGSLGTDEEIAYSDFDALLILRDQVFESQDRLARVTSAVISARKILSDYDPLQHHGFFAMTESDLKNYPETVFPRVLFRQAKSLLAHGTRLACVPADQERFAAEPLLLMLDAIDRKVRERVTPKTFFDLKLLLSQIMLLPSLYLQATGNPVFKRESFAIAEPQFEPSAWYAVQVASEIRAAWPALSNDLRHRVLRCLPQPFLIGIYQKKVGFKATPKLSSRIDQRFWQSLAQLSAEMRSRIAATRPVGEVLFPEKQNDAPGR